MILKVLDWSGWDPKAPKEPTDWERFEGDRISTRVISRETALESFRSANQHDNPFVHLLIAPEGMEGRKDCKLHVVFSTTGAHMVYAEGMQSYVMERGETTDRI